MITLVFGLSYAQLGRQFLFMLISTTVLLIEKKKEGHYSKGIKRDFC